MSPGGNGSSQTVFVPDVLEVDAIVDRWGANPEFAVEMLQDVQKHYRHLPKAARKANCPVIVMKAMCEWISLASNAMRSGSNTTEPTKSSRRYSRRSSKP